MSDYLPVPYDALPDLFEDDLRYHAQRVTACGEPVAAVVLYAVADAIAAARTRDIIASPNSWALAAFENEQARALAPLIEGDTPQ